MMMMIIVIIIIITITRMLAINVPFSKLMVTLSCAVLR